MSAWFIRDGRITVLLLGLLCACGCAQTRELRLAIFPLGGEEKIQPVPETGLYKVKALGVSADGMMTVPGSQRLLRQGDRLGFRRTTDGQIQALAGDESFDLDDVGSARSLMWFRSDEIPNAAAEELARGAAQLATLSAEVVLVGALVVLDSALDSQDDDGDHHDHHAHRDHRPHHDRTPR